MFSDDHGPRYPENLLIIPLPPSIALAYPTNTMQEQFEPLKNDLLLRAARGMFTLYLSFGRS